MFFFAIFLGLRTRSVLRCGIKKKRWSWRARDGSEVSADAARVNWVLGRHHTRGNRLNRTTASTHIHTFQCMQSMAGFVNVADKWLVGNIDLLSVTINLVWAIASVCNISQLNTLVDKSMTTSSPSAGRLLACQRPHDHVLRASASSRPFRPTPQPLPSLLRSGGCTLLVTSERERAFVCLSVHCTVHCTELFLPKFKGFFQKASPPHGMQVHVRQP
jgi:hypothetical protein